MMLPRYLIGQVHTVPVLLIFPDMSKFPVKTPPVFRGVTVNRRMDGGLVLHRSLFATTVTSYSPGGSSPEPDVVVSSNVPLNGPDRVTT